MDRRFHIKVLADGAEGDAERSDVVTRFRLRQMPPWAIIGLGMLLAFLLFALLDAVEQMLFPNAASTPLRLLHLVRGFCATTGGMMFVWWIMRHKETELLRLRDQFSDQLATRTAQLRQTNKQLSDEIERRKDAQAKLRRLVSDLARSNAGLQQFARIASHDLQEPLRVIEGYAGLLNRRYKGTLDARADEFLKTILDATKRMGELIDDVLLHAQVGSATKPFEMTDCSAVLDQVLANLAITIEETGASIDKEPLPTVMADRLQLVSLFQNLLSNAMKFRGSEPCRIRIWTERRGAEWVIFVQDNGIGIDPRYGNQMFEMFRRLHGRAYPGTGMGLAICKRIVEHHGGKIWFESEPGKGCTFAFSIPAEVSMEAA